MSFNLRLIPLMPFLGAAILMLFGRKWRRDTVLVVAAGAIACAAIVVFDAVFTALPGAGPGGLTDVVGTWMGAGSLKVDQAFRMDALSRRPLLSTGTLLVASSCPENNPRASIV